MMVRMMMGGDRKKRQKRVTSPGSATKKREPVTNSKPVDEKAVGVLAKNGTKKRIYYGTIILGPMLARSIYAFAV